MVEQHVFIENAKSRGYDVLLMDSPIDSHFIDFMERKNENTAFVRVDSDTIDKLINKEDALPSKLSEEQQNELKPIIESVLPAQKYTVVFESLSETDQPMQVTNPEFMRRMKEMQALGGGGMSFYGNMPDMYNLVVNSNHPIILKVLAEKSADKRVSLIKQTADLALLAQNLLKGEDLTNFIKRSYQIIEN
jgi:molecular chaperone HtpG